jgi:hypothetical protein
MRVASGGELGVDRPRTGSDHESMSCLSRKEAEKRSAVEDMGYGRQLRDDRTSNEVSYLGGQGESQFSQEREERSRTGHEPRVDSGKTKRLGGQLKGRIDEDRGCSTVDSGREGEKLGKIRSG